MDKSKIFDLSSILDTHIKREENEITRSKLEPTIIQSNPVLYKAFTISGSINWRRLLLPALLFFFFLRVFSCCSSMSYCFFNSLQSLY